MLGIDAKVAQPHVVDPGSDVVSLVDGEAIKTGCYRGSDNGTTYNQEEKDSEEAPT